MGQATVYSVALAFQVATVLPILTSKMCNVGKTTNSDILCCMQEALQHLWESGALL